MSKKVDYKKDFKNLYLPKTVPDVLEVPRMSFFMVSGSGDPNGEDFARATEALYSLSYAVRMSYKSDDVPDGYYEYTIMIRQPDFLTEQWFNRFLAQTKKKKPNPFLEKIRFEQAEDGLSCQMMHIGSFDEEAESFMRMEQFCTEHGYVRISKIHREIYLSDPRKTETAKLKTVLRFPVKKVD